MPPENCHHRVAQEGRRDFAVGWGHLAKRVGASLVEACGRRQAAPLLQCLNQSRRKLDGRLRAVGGDQLAVTHYRNRVDLGSGFPEVG